jgi:RsiW-degrading membrane proteinase PrsW (M82 family)
LIMDSRVSSTLSPLVPEIVALLGGIVSAVIIVLPLNTFFGFVRTEAIFIAPIIEEPAKATGVIFLAFRYPYVLASKVRGLILGGLAGLGFAFTENLFYAAMPETDVIARALLPVPMHVMASGVVGLGLVYLAQDQIEARKGHPGIGGSTFGSKEMGSLLAVAMVMHGQYNFLSYFGHAAGSLFGLVIASFVYYRLAKTLPEDLQFFTIPGPVKLLTSTVRYTPQRRVDVPKPKVISVTLAPSHRQSVHCINCGRPIPNSASICDSCGASQR